MQVPEVGSSVKENERRDSGFKGLVLIAVFGFAFLFYLGIFLDRVLYPDFPADKKFASSANSELSMDRKSALLFEAAIYQMKEEMENWTPNDPVIRWFDNRLNRKLGVRYAVMTITPQMSILFTNYGIGAAENADTQNGSASFSYLPNKWSATGQDTENTYESGLELIGKYIREADKANSSKMSNIKSDDLLNILKVLKAVLTEAINKVQDRNGVPYLQIDDRVYYAQGIAIVVRDVLVCLKSAYGDTIVKQSNENFAHAISTLDHLIGLKPWCVTSGDGPFLFVADTRAKYLLELKTAVDRIAETISAFTI